MPKRRFPTARNNQRVASQMPPANVQPAMPACRFACCPAYRHLMPLSLCQLAFQLLAYAIGDYRAVLPPIRLYASRMCLLEKKISPRTMPHTSPPTWADSAMPGLIRPYTRFTNRTPTHDCHALPTFTSSCRSACRLACRSMPRAASLPSSAFVRCLGVPRVGAACLPYVGLRAR